MSEYKVVNMQNTFNIEEDGYRYALQLTQETVGASYRFNSLDRPTREEREFAEEITQKKVWEELFLKHCEVNKELSKFKGKLPLTFHIKHCYESTTTPTGEHLDEVGQDFRCNLTYKYYLVIEFYTVINEIKLRVGGF